MGRRPPRRHNKPAQGTVDQQGSAKGSSEAENVADVGLHIGSVRHDVQFEEYYKIQQICPASEWQEFLHALRSSLPAAVRVNRGVFTAEQLTAQLERLAKASEEHNLYAPRRLTWYPHGLAWQWDSLCSWEIRKDAEHKRLKAYLLWLQNNGSLTRQEAVSMIPPLCLDIQPGQFVLDMCAAPGSKASQLIEIMQWGQGVVDTPTGVVIANEMDAKRADLLNTSLQRLSSPSTLITQVDAQYFPHLRVADGAPLLFDRILADVPCSGDGTMRKHPTLWDMWSPKDALGMHHRQYTILCRGLDFLRPGGRLVYSTCSFNPIEDEAVVAAALRRYGGSVRLGHVPVLEGMPGRPGLETWMVPHPDNGTLCWKRFEDVPKEFQHLLKSSMFPPLDGSAPAAAWAKVCGQCRRFLPHSARSGGFFVAVFEKSQPVVEDPDANRRATVGADGTGLMQEAEAVQVVSAETDSVAASRRDAIPKVTNLDEYQGGYNALCQRPLLSKRQKRAAKKPLQCVSDLESIPADDPAWLRIVSFFGVDWRLCPRLRRRKGCAKRLYCVSEEASTFLDSQSPFKLRVVQAGVRVFEQLGSAKHAEQQSWRLANEGLCLLIHHGLQRQIRMSRRIFAQFLQSRELPVVVLREAAACGEVQGLAKLKAGRPANFESATDVCATDCQPRPDARAADLDSTGEARPADTKQPDGSTSEGCQPAADATDGNAPAAPPLHDLTVGIPMDERLISGSIAVTLIPDDGVERATELSIAALLSVQCLKPFVSVAEATAILETLELEERTTRILSGGPKTERADVVTGDGSSQLQPQLQS